MVHLGKQVLAIGGCLVGSSIPILPLLLLAKLLRALPRPVSLLATMVTPIPVG